MKGGRRSSTWKNPCSKWNSGSTQTIRVPAALVSQILENVRIYARSQMGHHVYKGNFVVPGWMTITVRCLSDRPSRKKDLIKLEVRS